MEPVLGFRKHAAGAPGRSAAVTSLILLGLVASGCGIGMPGYQEYVDGNHPQAYRDFSADYENHPGNSVAQMNMAITYRDRGENDKANSLFREAAQSGKDVRPTNMTEPHERSTTVAEVACRYLALDHQSDPNCQAR